MGEVILQGPLPQTPLGFCFVCAGAAKYAAVQGGTGAEIRAHEAGGTGLRKFPVRGQPQPAVAFGVVPGMQIVAPLCWTHVSPIEVSNSGLLRANGALPQPGGAADLAERWRHG